MIEVNNKNKILHVLESSWKKHRKVLQPLFKYSNLKDYVEIYQKYAEKMLLELDAFNAEEENSDYVEVFYNNFFKIAFGKYIIRLLKQLLLVPQVFRMRCYKQND